MATRMQLSGYTRYWTRYVLLVLPFYLFTFLPLTAQEYGMRWLYCPQASETQQVWFKRTFHTTALAKEAVLSVASEGRYIVYVNGYNISADLFSYNPRGAIAIQDYPIEITTDSCMWHYKAHGKMAACSISRTTKAGCVTRQMPRRCLTAAN